MLLDTTNTTYMDHSWEEPGLSSFVQGRVTMGMKELNCLFLEPYLCHVASNRVLENSEKEKLLKRVAFTFLQFAFELLEWVRKG